MAATPRTPPCTCSQPRCLLLSGPARTAASSPLAGPEPRARLAHAGAQRRERELARREQQRRVGQHQRVQAGGRRAAQAAQAARRRRQRRQRGLQAARAGLLATRLQVLRGPRAPSRGRQVGSGALGAGAPRSSA